MPHRDDFLLEGSLPADKVALQFEGVMDDVPVVWNAVVRTMNNCLSPHKATDDPQQYIKIEYVNGVYLLEVALHVKQIDRAALVRTIIMIRKYKGLRVGCHTFGAKSKIS